MEKNLLDFVTTARNGYLSKIAFNDEDVINLLKTNKDVQNYLLPMYATMSLVNYKNAIKELLEYDKSFIYNKSFVLAVLKNDINLLDIFPHYKKDEEVQLIQLRHNPELINTFDSWFNEKKIIKAVIYNPLVYQYLSKEHRNNPKIIKNALTSPILYSKDANKVSIFFDIPENYQRQYDYVKLALKNNPKLYQFLPLYHKNNARVIKTVLKYCFYKPSYCRNYYQLQHTLPFIESQYYKRINNILWLAQAFEDASEENDIYFECTMLTFSSFLNNSINQNKLAKEFFKLNGLDIKFNSILKTYQERLYKQDLFPTGLELEIKQFFKENLPNLAKSLKSFVLLNKIEKKISKEKILNKINNYKVKKI